jgi:hypothetical protein
MGVLETNYLEMEQPHTKIKLVDKIKVRKYTIPNNDIIVEFDANLLTRDTFNILTQLPEIITESGEVGEFELSIFKITIKSLTNYENNLVHIYNK